MNFNCLVTGIGGQGAVLASRIIGTAAFIRGFEVRGANTAGLARRGGCAASHIRFGKNIHSPLIPQGKADLVIALEPAEAVRVRTYLSPTGRMIVLDRGIVPFSVMAGEAQYPLKEMLAFLEAYLNRPSEERLAQKDAGDWLEIIDTTKLVSTCGSPRVLNTALLGAAAGKKLLPLAKDEIIQAIKELVPPEYLDINIRAFNAGLELAKP